MEPARKICHDGVMSDEKIIHVFDIETSGKKISMANLGSTDDQFSYAVEENAPQFELTGPIFLNRPEFAGVFPAGFVRRHTPMVCAVQNCFLMGPFGYVVLPTGMLIRQSAANLDAASLEYSFGHFQRQLPGKHIPWDQAGRPVFSVNGFSTNNYFHFLIDALGHMHWRDRVPAARGASLVVSGYPQNAEQPFMTAALRRGKIAPTEIHPFDGTLLHCAQLIFPRRDTGANPQKVEWVRRRLGVEGRPRGDARIYVARGAAPRRRVINEMAVEKLLTSHGFTLINPDAMTMDEQIELFAGASIVVGPHGAGLTNAIFMAPGGVLVELTHTKRVVWTYHEVACAAKQAYACVVGDFSGDEAEPLFGDLNVDI
jgi:capsular polysaccharide biosynthesis protein